MVVILKFCFVQIFNFYLYKIKNMYFHKKLYSIIYIDFLLILLKIKIFVY